MEFFRKYGLSHVLPLVSLSMTILSAVFAYQAIQSSYDIAYKSGQFDRAKLTVGIGPFDLGAIAPPLRYVVILPEGSGEDLRFGRFQLRISNDGQKAIKGLTVSFRYHPLFIRRRLEEVTRYEGSMPKQILPYEHSVSTVGGRDFSVYTIQQLVARQSVELEEPIVLKPTKLKSSVEVGEGKKISFSMSYSLKYEILISTDETSFVLPVSLAAINATDEKAAVEEIKRTIVASQQREIRAATSFVRYLSGLIFGGHVGYLITRQPDFDLAATGSDGKIYVEKSDERRSYGLLQYNQFSWGLLFGSY